MKKLATIFITLLALSACKKVQTTPASVPVKFTSTTYANLGTIDASGKPTYLVPNDAISTDLLSFINSTLVEGTNLQKTHPELLSNSAIADLKMTQKSDVYVTYVSTGPGTLFKNTIAFYTYPSNNAPTAANDIKTITYIFPNAGNETSLQSGNKVKIGTFDVGTSIGFVLLQNAWNSTTQSINTDAVHFCSNDALNPETNPALKKHAVLINYNPEKKVLIGFEDSDRTTVGVDNDFNDVVVYATVTPAG
jgi:hypothetical protein